MNDPPSLPRARFSCLSVVIPAYNAAETIGEQLQALMAQDFEGDWEVVVADNRSHDATADIVRDFQRRMPQLRLVNASGKRGASYARNVGARAARGDALLFCDTDDVAASGWLRAFAEALEHHDIVAGALDKESLNRSSPWRPQTFVSTDKPMLGFLPYIPGANMGMLRACFDAVGGFSEDMPTFEDVDLVWRLQLHGFTLHDAPAAVMRYRHRCTLRALWRQHVEYGEGQALLYRRFASYGMPRGTVLEALKRNMRLIIRSRCLMWRDIKAQSSWVQTAAMSWGRIKGSLRHGTLFL